MCATTKKAKACKDCSCGLAEELEANRIQDGPKPPAPDTSNAKSSCGSVSEIVIYIELKSLNVFKYLLSNLMKIIFYSSHSKSFLL